MSVGYSIITPTGDRPDPFRLCFYYVHRQVIRPKEWIVVDDGTIPTRCPSLSWIKYIRRERVNGEPDHTLRVQIAEALKHVTTENVLIMEDDDWYDPFHCDTILGLLKEYDLVGQGNAVYYHIPARRYAILNNMDRASWCQTGFKSLLISDILSLCKKSRDPFLDLDIWRLSNVRKKVVSGRESPKCIGIKGLPGRQGTTMGWKSFNYGMFKDDKDGVILRQYIGEDADLYKEFQK